MQRMYDLKQLSYWWNNVPKAGGEEVGEPKHSDPTTPKPHHRALRENEEADGPDGHSTFLKVKVVWKAVLLPEIVNKRGIFGVRRERWEFQTNKITWTEESARSI